MAEWITTAEAAALTGYTIVHVRRLVTAGKVKGQRFGQIWQVDRRSLLAYFKRAAKSGEKRGPKPKG